MQLNIVQIPLYARAVEQVLLFTSTNDLIMRL